MSDLLLNAFGVFCFLSLSKVVQLAYIVVNLQMMQIRLNLLDNSNLIYKPYTLKWNQYN